MGYRDMYCGEQRYILRGHICGFALGGRAGEEAGDGGGPIKCNSFIYILANCKYIIHIM